MMSSMLFITMVSNLHANARDFPRSNHERNIYFLRCWICLYHSASENAYLILQI